MSKKAVTLSLLVTLISSVLAAEPVEVISRANEIAIAGDIARAKNILEEAIEENPASLPLYNALARIHTISGDLNEAERILRIGISEKSEAGVLFENLLSINELRVAERYRRALGVKSDSDSVDHVARITESWQIQSEIAEAQQALVGVAARAPDDASVAIIPFDENSEDNVVAVAGVNDKVAVASDVVANSPSAIDAFGADAESAAEAVSGTLGSATDIEENANVIAGEGDDVAAITEAVKQASSEGEQSVTGTGEIETSEELETNEELVAKEETEPSEVAETQPEVNVDQIAESVLNEWQTAWSSRDADAYIATYVANYSPSDDMSHDEWMKDRRQNFASKSSIEISTSDVTSNAIDDKRIRVRFTQDYKSNNYSDTVVKRITLLQSNDQWLIEQEIASPIN